MSERKGAPTDETKRASTGGREGDVETEEKEEKGGSISPLRTAITLLQESRKNNGEDIGRRRNKRGQKEEEGEAIENDEIGRRKEGIA